MYWTNFRQPTAYVQQDTFGKTLIEVGNLHLYASFGTFCVQIGQLYEAQWYFRLSEDFEIDDSFLQKQRSDHYQTFFRDSLVTDVFAQHQHSVGWCP